MYPEFKLRMLVVGEVNFKCYHFELFSFWKGTQRMVERHRQQRQQGRAGDSPEVEGEGSLRPFPRSKINLRVGCDRNEIAII